MTERVSYIEIDLNRCGETYGVAPCTASGPATDKCFNCFATCQDKPNYDITAINADGKTIATSRHSSVSSHLPVGIDAIPDVKSVSVRPARLDLGESIGVRASITITFKDSAYPDTGPEGDQYLSDRDYDPYTQGTYWGKFRARYPFTQGSDIRLIRGDSTQSLAQMETRHFIVDTVSGPDSSGTFTIICKDALKLADSKRAQCPLVSQGVTQFGISDVSTSFLLSPTGIGNLEYPGTGIINLGGKELCRFTRSGDNMDIGTLGERGVFGTTPTSHSAGDRAQLAVEYEAQRASLILESLLKDYANVPDDYINQSDWVAEDISYIDRNYSAVIAEPVSVTKLVNELLQQTASTIWWDDVAKKMQFKTLKAVGLNASIYNDDIIVENSFSAKDQNSKRVSQVWTFYGQINPLEKLDDKSNYSQGRVIISPESEANFEGVPSIKSIFSRWIPVNGEDAATRLNQLILSRYTTPPRLIAFTLQRHPLLSIPVLGNGYNAQNFTLQNDKGGLATVPIQLVTVKSTDTNYSVIGEEVLYEDTVAPDEPDVKPVPLYTGENQNIRDVFDSIYPSVVSGDTVNVTIGSGQNLTSASTALPALVTGDWPAGVILNLLNNGVIVGRGGNGGQGGSVKFDLPRSVEDASDGVAGGTAITIGHDTSITNNGIIGGGGGGGGGGGSVVTVGGTGFVTGSGGGGGSGLSNGGLEGISNVPPSHQNTSYGNPGAAGGITVQGSGGDIVLITLPSSLGYIGCGAGGGAGSLGANGLGGGVGFSELFALTSNGGAGGAAGDAMDKNGFTVTIEPASTGDIFGTVNP